MATAGGYTGPALKRVVGEQYGRFNVFQLVRLLRHRRGGAYPIGQRLRFRADLRAGFPGREITRLAQAKPMPAFRSDAHSPEKLPARIEVHTPNYCLASELGSLPEPFLEWVRDEQRQGSHAMAAFLDVFNQRVHVLRHELKQRSLRALDPAMPADTRYAGQLAALMGMGLPAQCEQMPLPRRAWLGLAGLLVNSRKSAIVVAQVLSAFIGVPARLRMLVGSWRDIEEADRMALGRRGHALGRSSLLGARTWDARAAVRLDVDRMRFDAVTQLLPLRGRHGTPHDALAALIRLLLDRRFDCEVCIELDPASIPPARLDSDDVHTGLRLGQTAWLGKGGMRAHADGAVVRFRVPAFCEEAGA